jgi:hypothetical protein
MSAHEILKTLPDQRGLAILDSIRTIDPNAFKVVLLTLAERRRLRPVFVQKKPRSEQAAWILKNLRLRSEDHVAEHVLQLWLVKTQEEMIVRFLDVAEIDHDGEGMVDELPETLDTEKVKAAADLLFEKFDHPLVTLYLTVFQLQRPGGWPEIAAILEEDPRATLS